MPIFEYKCKECEHTFELLQLPGHNDDAPKCPECGSTELKKLISTPFLPADVGKPANEEPASGGTSESSESSAGSEGDNS